MSDTQAALIGIAIPILAIAVLGSMSRANNEPVTRNYENNYKQNKYFKGYECTEDCSGHEAGYAWAEDKGIYNKYDCSTKSNSFNEGCLSYIEDSY